MKFRRTAFAIAIALMVAGCKAAPPVVVPLSGLSSAMANQRVSVTGTVRDPRFDGFGYGHVHFVLVEGSREIRCVAAGYNLRALSEAAALLDEAAAGNELVTVTGHYRVGPYRYLEQGERIDVQSIRSRGQEIDLSYGAGYPGYYYYYPYSPYWAGWRFGFRYCW
jgi:hypothetical protein